MVSLYADVELVVRGYLLTALGLSPGQVGVEIPANLADVVPFIRVERIGGGDAGGSLDGPRVDVDCFAIGRLATNDFAGQVRTALRGLAGYTMGGVTVASVGVNTFGWRPYTNVNVRSVGMTADLVLHNHQ